MHCTPSLSFITAVLASVAPGSTKLLDAELRQLEHGTLYLGTVYRVSTDPQEREVVRTKDLWERL